MNVRKEAIEKRWEKRKCSRISRVKCMINSAEFDMHETNMSIQISKINNESKNESGDGTEDNENYNNEKSSNFNFESTQNVISESE